MIQQHTNTGENPGSVLEKPKSRQQIAKESAHHVNMNNVQYTVTAISPNMYVYISSLIFHLSGCLIIARNTPYTRFYSKE